MSGLTKISMRRIIIFIAGLLIFAQSVKADDRPVNFDQLPKEAQKFVSRSFPNIKVLYASKDDDFFFPDYQVGLENGIKVKFNNDGSVKKIESFKGGIPDSLIPQQIRQYVAANYQNVVFLEYEIDKHYYEVKLSNRLELKFNKSFHLIDIED